MGCNSSSAKANTGEVPAAAVAPKTTESVFSVEIDTAGQKLGLNLKVDTLIITEIKEGPVLRHNELHPELLIKVGDEISEVNGSKVKSTSDIAELLKKDPVMKATLRRKELTSEGTLLNPPSPKAATEPAAADEKGVAAKEEVKEEMKDEVKEEAKADVKVEPKDEVVEPKDEVVAAVAVTAAEDVETPAKVDVADTTAALSQLDVDQSFPTEKEDLVVLRDEELGVAAPEERKFCSFLCA